MAVAARQAKVAAGNMELETAAAKVENVAVSVDLGDGRVGVFTVQAQVPDSEGVVYHSQIQEPTVPQMYSWSSSYSYAFLFAFILTVMCGSLLILWALPCSITAWILACYAEHTHKNREYKRAKGIKIFSFCLSFAAIASGILIPLVITLGTLFRTP